MMLESQEPQTSIEAGMQGASEHCQGVSERSVQHEVWSLVTVHTRRQSPPPINLKVSNRTAIFYKRYTALDLEGESTDEGKGAKVPPGQRGQLE